VARNDVRLFLRDRGTIFWSFVGPILFIGFFGLMFRDSGPPSSTVVYLQDQDHGGTLARAMALLLRDDGVVVREVPADSTPPATNFRLVIPAGSADSLAAGRPPRIQLLTPNDSATPREQTLRAQVVRALMSSYLGLGATDARAALDSATVRTRVHIEPRVRLDKRAIAVPLQSAGFQRTVPSYMIMFLIMTLLTSGAELLIQERRAGLLRRTMAASVQPSEVMLGKVVARFAFAWIQIGVMVLVGVLLFHVRIGAHLEAALAVLTSFALCATGLGMLFSTFFRNPDKAAGVGVLVTLMLAALGGCWWPLEIVPKWMANIAWALPTGWGFDGLNRVMALDATVQQVSHHIVVLLGFAAVTLPLAAWRLARHR
jgi:ABC-type Na+ efflux pump permease subunit